MSENLSEALKAGGRGENLIEAPLLSFKKKKKQKEKKNKINKSLCEICMQIAGVLWRRGSLSTQSQGSLSCSQDTSPAPPPRMLIFSKVCALSLQLESSTERRRFSTGRCGLSTGRAAFLQEALYFYRKLPVEAQNGPECIS